MSVEVTYTAESLEDIAQEFDRRARLAREQRESTTSGAGLKIRLSERAATWEDAAAMLRATTIKGPKAVSLIVGN